MSNSDNVISGNLDDQNTIGEPIDNQDENSTDTTTANLPAENQIYDSHTALIA